MSDFLTNLVMRSFSGAPSVQPLTNSPHATYAEPPEALPEALPEARVESFEQHVNKPAVVKETVATPVETVAEPTRHVTSVDPFVPQIQTETFESEQSVFPSITQLSTPDDTIPKPQIKTETITNTEINQPPIQLLQPVTRYVPNKPVKTPDPVIKRETVSEPERELEIVEHVIERSSVAPPVEHQIEREVTRPLTRQVTRQVTRHVTRPVTRQVTIDNTIENTVEKTIEHTIENTQRQQQLTSSFTTLIPNTPPRLLPTRKSRQHTPVPALSNDVDQPAPQPETVINVAIGRIEVRANPASTPKRERQQNGPKIMTLDDYLQKRSRGAQ